MIDLFVVTPLRTGGRPMKQPQLKSGPECPTPYFPNGVAKPRQRNKMIRFTCASGFTLVGNMYSMCEKGRWDTPIPICISKFLKIPRTDKQTLHLERILLHKMLFREKSLQEALV